MRNRIFSQLAISFLLSFFLSFGYKPRYSKTPRTVSARGKTTQDPEDLLGTKLFSFSSAKLTTNRLNVKNEKITQALDQNNDVSALHSSQCFSTRFFLYGGWRILQRCGEMCMCMVHILLQTCGWPQRFVGALNCQVSIGKEPYFL